MTARACEWGAHFLKRDWNLGKCGLCKWTPNQGTGLAAYVAHFHAGPSGAAVHFCLCTSVCAACCVLTVPQSQCSLITLHPHQIIMQIMFQLLTMQNTLNVYASLRCVWCKWLCHIKSDTGNSAHCGIIGCHIVWGVVTDMQMSAFCRTESIWHSHGREIAFLGIMKAQKLRNYLWANSPPISPAVAQIQLSRKRRRTTLHSCSLIAH